MKLTKFQKLSNSLEMLVETEMHVIGQSLLNRGADPGIHFGRRTNGRTRSSGQ